MASSQTEQLIQDKLTRLDNIPAEFVDSVSKIQRELLNEIRLILAEFERDGEFIATSAANIDRINQLRSRLQQVLFGSDYVRAVRDFVTEFDAQADINSALYAATVGYSESAVTAALINTSKNQALELLLGGAMDREFYTPVLEAINASVSTGAGFAETVQNLRLVIEGGEVLEGKAVEGKLLRYTRQIASDQFAITDRTYNNNVSSELGLEFYRYVGGMLDTTREFCKARNGQYFHFKEVEEWVTGGGTPEGNPEPNVEWEGRNIQTNTATIFNFCGGYNCKHTLMPVSTAAVPVEVLKRNVDAGNFNPTEKQKQVLELA